MNSCNIYFFDSITSNISQEPKCYIPRSNEFFTDNNMRLCHTFERLAVGGVFSTAEEFDLAVSRFDQDKIELLKLARRNKTTIHHICSAQARERERISELNKGKKRK